MPPRTAVPTLPSTTLPAVSVVASSAAIRADAVVIGTVREGDRVALAPGAEPVDDLLGGRLLDALRALGATGRPDEVLRVPTLGLADVPLVVATGLGGSGLGGSGLGAAASDPSTAAEAARRATGAAFRLLAASSGGAKRVHVAIDAPAGALAEGALLGGYAFTAFKSAPAARPLRTVTIASGDTRAAKADARRAAVVARAVTLVRDLVNTPANELYPESFAAHATALAGGQGLTVEVLDEKALRRGRYGGILGVGMGSARPPRLVRIEYRPARARAHLALVGKGITFDSGGLNLKSPPGMLTMKDDMGGAAAVVAAVLAIAELKLPVSVTATAPMAENMPSGTAYRPSDVLRMYDGSTVEVKNTDAEGRIVLADALTRAGEDDPDFLIEASTLTGAQVTALGPRLIGAMGTDTWRDEVVRAAGTAGEGIWAMPLPDDLRAALDSSVADIANVSGESWGGMLLAGRFLGEYVPDGVPWVHLDIAGPAFNTSGPRDYTPKGATGAGVRTMISAAERLARGGNS
ncbi:leucyl aminopeptidase [Jatrophihabitans endophyticus]|uniref:leucyl aminopeptidase n=1 Tax=Jatrophihabitans endophyticus TaxID=1206085 RepID=UPI0019E9DEFE|nr:leucyl aminopeptidase [Jatrophihabitans endophyticus]MBE7186823.1 leucyl aminopeptidase [Jatrophihabitans endophyticus]